MILPTLVILLVCSVFSVADAQVATAITGSGYLSKFVLYQGTNAEGRPIVEINSGDVIDQAIVGTNLTIVALTDLTAIYGPNPTSAQRRNLPTLRWTYGGTGYIDKYRPYTMVGDYVDFQRYAPVAYLSTPGFKKILVKAYTTTGKGKTLVKTPVGQQILEFEIINSNSAPAEVSALYLVRTSVDKEQAKLTPITDGLTYNITTLFGSSQKDLPMLSLSLKAMFKGPVEASKVTFSFLNGKRYSYEGKKDDATVEMYLAMEDLMKVGKKTVTVNAFDSSDALLVSESYSFTLTH